MAAPSRACDALIGKCHLIRDWLVDPALDAVEAMLNEELVGHLAGLFNSQANSFADQLLGSMDVSEGWRP